jgi:mannose-6-phosphate isomerase-like protein (cupin superfamily)
MTTLEVFNESPYKLIKNYFKINTDWETALTLLYKNSDKSQHSPGVLWFKIKNRKIFKEIPDLKTFCENINKDSNSEFFEDCSFNDDWYSGYCDCSGLWHLDGPVLSLDYQGMQSHKDVFDTAYIQILGNSFWTLGGEIEVTLNPGDLLYVSKKITHAVKGEGPRFGALIVAPRYKGSTNLKNSM